MALQVRITQRAVAQIEAAERWWSVNRLKAPDAFLDDLQAALQLLAIQPGIGTRIANTRLAGVRRLHLGRVRYFIFYRVKGNELMVLALWHASRRSVPPL